MLESPTPDFGSAAVGLLDPSAHLPFTFDPSSILRSVSSASVAASNFTTSHTSRTGCSSSMKMLPKRYTNVHNLINLGPISSKQLKEAMVII